MDFTAGRRPARARLLGGLQLTSMVDVIFLLLIYFLMTTSYTPPEARLTPALQAERVSGGAAADLEPQVIHVELFDGEPSFRLGDRVLKTRNDLRDVLEQLPKEAGVFVRGSDRVPVAFGVAALQASYDAGFFKVTYVPGGDG
jgi:biopolymer transport protein ExbD